MTRSIFQIIFFLQFEIVYNPPYGRFTTGGAGTLIMTEGPPDPFSPSFNFVIACIEIIAACTLLNTAFVCYFDPDTTKDPYPEGWELEGLDEIEANGKNGLDDPNALHAPRTDAELKIAAVKAAVDRKKKERTTREEKRKKKLRYKRGCYSFFCYPILVITFVKSSFRNTRESFLLVTTKMIMTSCQTIPLSTMFLWLSFSTPRGMTDLITFCLAFQYTSIVLTIIMWERSALRTEKNVILRLMHSAVLRIFFARSLELLTNGLIFSLFTTQYGTMSIGILLVIDSLSIFILMCMTWRQQQYMLAGSLTKSFGVFRRYCLTLPILLVLHFDHIPGKSGENHSIINPRMYYAWRVARHSLLSILVLPGISEMTERVAMGWYVILFVCFFYLFFFFFSFFFFSFYNHLLL